MTSVFALLKALIGALLAATKPRASLVAESLALRQQLAILRRTTPRPRQHETELVVLSLGAFSFAVSSSRDLESTASPGATDGPFKTSKSWFSALTASSGPPSVMIEHADSSNIQPGSSRDAVPFG
jgi:hypothetical protein